MFAPLTRRIHPLPTTLPIYHLRVRGHLPTMVEARGRLIRRPDSQPSLAPRVCTETHVWTRLECAAGGAFGT